MLEALDSILEFFILLMIPSFFIGLIGVGFGIYAASKNKTLRKKPIKLARILFGQLIIIMVLSNSISWFIRSQSRVELKNLLNEKDLKVIIDGTSLNLNDSKKIISELKQIEPHFGRNSYELTFLKIEISSKSNSMEINLRKDKRIKNRYWVFRDKYVATSQHEIGRIKTKTL